MGIYDNPYFVDNVYGHTRALLERVGSRRGGLHLDIGCGFGRMAEALRDDLGLVYVGLDMDDEALASLRERGFEAFAIDLRDLPSARKAIEQAIGGRSISSLSILDTLEHVAEPGLVLGVLYAVARPAQAPLVVSVPNAGHRDVGFKLAFGRWDYTPTGLLDHTHLRCFTEAGFDRLMRGVGWYEVAKLDVLLEKSDQSFPALHPALGEATSLHRLLRGLRDLADQAGSTNQFVRAYLPGQPLGAHPAITAETEEAGPFLSVITRTQGRRLDTLREALLCLSSQTDEDFEVIVVGHRLDVERQLKVERVLQDTHERMRAKVRLLRVDRGNRTAPLNEGFAAARGKYVAIVDDDDVLFANWVETFKALARAFPGRVLRSCAVAQTFEPVATSLGSRSVRAVHGFEPRYPKEFDLLDHLSENRTPPVALAFPRSAFADLHIQFDEDLTTTEDWDFLMRTAAVCDVASAPAITCVYRQWQGAESSFTAHSREEWKANHHAILRKFDRLPLILPQGAATRIRALLDAEHERGVTPSQPSAVSLVPRNVSEVRERARVILSSRSWRLTAPLRIPAALVGRRPPPVSAVWSMSPEQVEQLVQSLERTWSWRLTGLIRRAKKALIR